MAQVTHGAQLCFADKKTKNELASPTVETRRPHLTPHVCKHISNFALLSQLVRGSHPVLLQNIPKKKSVSIPSTPARLLRD